MPASPADTTATEILNPDSGSFNYSYCYCGALAQSERGREGGGGGEREEEGEAEGRAEECWCFLRKAAFQIEYACAPSGFSCPVTFTPFVLTLLHLICLLLSFSSRRPHLPLYLLYLQLPLSPRVTLYPVLSLLRVRGWGGC